MRRQRALRAKVVVGLDDADAEELAPPAVDCHASRQWILRIDDPVREIEAISRLRRSGEYGRETRRHLRPLTSKVAGDHHRSLARHLAFADDHGRDRVRLALL